MTIARDVDATRATSALDLAMSDAGVENEGSSWTRDDITRVEIIAVDDEYVPEGDPRRLSLSL